MSTTVPLASSIFADVTSLAACHEGGVHPLVSWITLTSVSVMLVMFVIVAGRDANGDA